MAIIKTIELQIPIDTEFEKYASSVLKSSIEKHLYDDGRWSYSYKETGRAYEVWRAAKGEK